MKGFVLRGTRAELDSIRAKKVRCPASDHLIYSSSSTGYGISCANCQRKLTKPVNNDILFQVLAVAQYASVHIAMEVMPAQGSSSPHLSCCSGPPSKNLVLSIGNDFHITMTNSMIRAIASVALAKELLGRNDSEAAEVDSWLCFLWHSIELPLHVLNESSDSLLTASEGKEEMKREVVKSQLKSAIETIDAYMTKKEQQSLQSSYFVGEGMTLADICLAVSLKFSGVHLMQFLEPESTLGCWFTKIENECYLEKLA